MMVDSRCDFCNACIASDWGVKLDGKKPGRNYKGQIFHQGCHLKQQARNRIDPGIVETAPPELKLVHRRTGYENTTPMENAQLGYDREGT